MKTNKEMLRLILAAVEKEKVKSDYSFNGICQVAMWIRMGDELTREEYYKFCRFMAREKKKLGITRDYWWTPGHWEPRTKWINEKLNS